MYVIVPRKSTETLEKLDFQLRVKTRLQDHLRTPWPCHLLPVVQCTAHAIRLIELHTTPVHTMSVQTVPVHSAHYASANYASAAYARACDRETNRPQLVADKQ